MTINLTFYTCFSKVGCITPQPTSNNVPNANNPSKGLVAVPLQFPFATFELIKSSAHDLADLLHFLPNNRTLNKIGFPFKFAPSRVPIILLISAPICICSAII
ncbi:conserved hypothetical protein [Trichinella spiralis]|uniref:hypothetical protein n=1 Tax=Trichinella spiralis TaxID=6334 RepID=UPI0001EFE4FE|nr:conserved hypothetical protein [Trichinella spiralis]